MGNYNKLMKLFDKEVISFQELREITDDELVSEVLKAAPDNRYKDMYKYEIHLTTGDIYYAYIKKPWYHKFLRNKNVLPS